MDRGSRGEGVDVVVVGAGLSGLQAARTLERGGARVWVLEARERVGGRTMSKALGSGTFDLGGQWIGPTQHRALALVRELGLTLFPTHTGGQKVVKVNGRRTTYKGLVPRLSLPALLQIQLGLMRLERLRHGVPRARPHLGERAGALDATTIAAWIDAHTSNKDAAAVLKIAVRSVYSAEPAEISALHFLWYANSAGGVADLVDTAGGAQENRLAEGTQPMSEGIAAALEGEVTLGEPVESITQGAGGVVARCRSGLSVEARYAIVALPPPVSGQLRYEPIMPPRRSQLLQRMPMGYTIKVLALYDRAFWREAGLSGEAICDAGPVTFIYDNTSSDGAQPCLVAFVAGDAARYWGTRPDAERREAVLGAIADLLGAQARRPTGYIEQNWNAEPFSGGCPVAFASPGAMVGCGPSLREPHGRVHWAGTELATRWAGYMDGALQSGERAGLEVIERLKKENN